MEPNQDIDKPVVYQICVRGKFDEKWSDWFGGMHITFGSGSSDSHVTTLTGLVVDQAALRGIMDRIWDLNLTLISVARIETIF
jgi:hypothetical protein